MKRDKIQPTSYTQEQMEQIVRIIAQEAASIARYYYHPKNQYNHAAAQYIAAAIEEKLVGDSVES
jgi:hypothetical protein